jgi:hypothetical protein
VSNRPMVRSPATKLAAGLLTIGLLLTTSFRTTAPSSVVRRSEYTPVATPVSDSWWVSKLAGSTCCRTT